MYKLRFLQIKLIKKCIKEVHATEYSNQRDKEITLDNYNKVLQRLNIEKGLFTKIY